jgi:hypothetical protein
MTKIRDISEASRSGMRRSVRSDWQLGYSYRDREDAADIFPTLISTAVEQSEGSEATFNLGSKIFGSASITTRKRSRATAIRRPPAGRLKLQCERGREESSRPFYHEYKSILPSLLSAPPFRNVSISQQYFIHPVRLFFSYTQEIPTLLPTSIGKNLNFALALYLFIRSRKAFLPHQ